MRLTYTSVSTRILSFRGLGHPADLISPIREFAPMGQVLVVDPLSGKHLPSRERECAERFFVRLSESLSAAGIDAHVFSDPLLAAVSDAALNHSFVLQAALRRSSLMIAPHDTASRISNQHGLEIVRVVPLTIQR